MSVSLSRRLIFKGRKRKAKVAPLFNAWALVACVILFAACILLLAACVRSL